MLETRCRARTCTSIGILNLNLYPSFIQVSGKIWGVRQYHVRVFQPSLFSRNKYIYVPPKIYICFSPLREHTLFACQDEKEQEAKVKEVVVGVEWREWCGRFCIAIVSIIRKENLMDGERAVEQVISHHSSTTDTSILQLISKFPTNIFKSSPFIGQTYKMVSIVWYNFNIIY